jgi:GT2 family glycosyltransferase
MDSIGFRGRIQLSDVSPSPNAELAVSRPVGRVFAGVLSYNRKETAAICLRALLAQTRPVDQVVVFDNGSTDGTKDYLEREGLLTFENVSFVRVEKNQGPAAGFRALFQHCYAEGCDWLWVMDDDVIPEPNALEELVSAYTTNFSTPESIGFLASYLRTPDGQPNNVPDIDNRQEGFAPPQWAELLGQGLVRVKFSTLCADLIPRSTMERFGFPCADFYYGGEDIDYSLRITHERPAYLVGRSTALHLRAVTGKFHILAETDPARIPFYYYYYRNQLYLRRAYLGRYSLVRFVIFGIWDACLAAPRGKMGRSMSATVLRGLAAGIFFQPTRSTPS